jgi:flavin-dependent dehydrogenase
VPEDGVDVGVIGAGPAGAVAAQTLARGGARVEFWESLPGPRWRIGETLPPDARPLLGRLGVLGQFEADGHLPSFGNLSAWGVPTLEASDFIFQPYGNGWQLDRERFDTSLARAAEAAGAVLRYGTRLAGVRREGDGWSVWGSCGGSRREMRARWLVDATGRRTIVARHLGALRSEVDHLVCVYSIGRRLRADREPDRDTRTLVEAVPDGWWYTAVMPRGRRTVAWLCDRDILRDHPKRTRDWFRARLQTTTHVWRTVEQHGYEFDDPPRFTGASSARSVPPGGPGWLAVGDAAASFDPLSSQGLVNALRTGLQAGQAISDALAGDLAAAQRYLLDVEDTWLTYLRTRLAYYRSETRWMELPFWSQRQ